MKPGERGFTQIELMVAIAIMALVSVAAMTVTFQVFQGTKRSNGHLTTVCRVQSAGHWISRDARMAQSVSTDNLTLPDLLVMNWTEWDEADEPIYHSVTYFFEDLADGIGRLKRSHWSSAGANEQTLVADYIYYDPGDTDNSSKFSYQSPVLTVQLAALFDGILETREYRIAHRPNF